MKGKGRKKHMWRAERGEEGGKDGPMKTYNASGESVLKGLCDGEPFRGGARGESKIGLVVLRKTIE